MACGIYKLVNVVNNKFYIGSSRNLYERKQQHKYRTKHCMGNSILKNAIIKYGRQNFKFEILEEFIFGEYATNKYIDEVLESREQFYVDILHPKYNIRLKDITRNTGVCSEMQKEHLRKIAKLSKNPELSIANGLARRGKFKGENNKKSIEVDVYDRLTLTFIETIKGIRECARVYNMNCTHVDYFCREGYTSQYLGKFIFCFHDIDITKMLRLHAKFTFKRKDAVAIVQTDKNGTFIKEWRTGSDAEKELGLYKGSVSRVISGEYSHTKNYYFTSKN